MSGNQHMIRTLRSANAQLKDANQELQTEVKRLRQIIHALNTLQYNLDAITPKTDVQGLISNILTAALKAVDSGNGSLLLFSPKDYTLVFVEVLGHSRDQLLGYQIPAHQGIAGWVLANNMPIRVEDVRKDKHWFADVDEVTGFSTASLIGVPLYDGERPLGVIEIVNTRSGKPFQEKDLDVLTLVARLATLALVRAEEETKE